MLVRKEKLVDTIDYYNKHAAQYYDNTVELNMEEILERFIELLPEDAEVLDLGCGSGRDSLYMLENGFDVTAIDGSEELCELASIHIGQDVLFMNFEEIEFVDVFDGVWACASLVHIEKNKIKQILDKIFRSLHEEGILYFSVLEGEFEGVRNGRYFSDYRTKELRELLEDYERIEIIDIFKTDDIRKDRKEKKWINVLVKKVRKGEYHESNKDS